MKGAQLKLGRFRLLACIGRGGMAEVWRAQIDGPGAFAKTVAVKRILPHLRESAKTIKLFEREAAHMARLYHPNIVQVIELAQVGDEYLIVMELVDGLDLKSLLLPARPLPLGFALHVAIAVCGALDHAHHLRDEERRAISLVHRDLSPSNVLVARDGAIKVSDFGVAKMLEEVSAETQSEVRGKLAYMSPEQASGARIDPRSDQFSVGVLLFELLTGERPFLGPAASLELMQGGRPPAPSARVPSLPVELDAICERVMAAQPADRYPGCRELAAALEPLAAAHPWSVAETQRLVAAHTVEKRAPKIMPPTLSAAPAAAPARSRWPWVALAVVTALAGVAVERWLASSHHAVNADSTAPVAPAVSSPMPASAATATTTGTVVPNTPSAPTATAAAPATDPPAPPPVEVRDEPTAEAREAKPARDAKAAGPSGKRHKTVAPKGDPRFPELRDVFR